MKPLNEQMTERKRIPQQAQSLAQGWPI